jgi:hypothetical protein
MATVYKIVLLRHGESEWCAPPAPDAATRDYARSDDVPPLRCVMTLALLPHDEGEPLRSVPRRACQAHCRVARWEAHPLASTLYCAQCISLPLRVLTPTPPYSFSLSPTTHRNRSNQFTGWTDVDLTELGVEEAGAAGKLLKAEVSGGPWAPPPCPPLVLVLPHTLRRGCLARTRRHSHPLASLVPFRSHTHRASSSMWRTRPC